VCQGKDFVACYAGGRNLAKKTGGLQRFANYAPLRPYGRKASHQRETEETTLSQREKSFLNYQLASGGKKEEMGEREPRKETRGKYWRVDGERGGGTLSALRSP